jgi:putative transposase
MAYSGNRVNIHWVKLMHQLTDLKKECIWLKEVDSQTLQQAILDLDKAYSRFFKKHSAFPKFKRKNRGVQSFRNPQGGRVLIKDGKIFQAKFIEGIKIIIDREFTGQIKSTTISKTPTGKYFVSVLVDTHIPIPEKKSIIEQTTIGIDLGLKSFIVTSDGIKVDNPKHLKKSLSHLKFLHHQASKKIKGSANRRKAVHKLTLQYEKVTNQRKDFLHKLSTQLVKSHDTLCFEDLNISGMVKNHNLAQSISDVGWGMFVDFCKYKSEWYGKNILQIPTFEPSTKICSVCGTTNHTLTLADREWICANCGTLHDRDINAAINIKNYCLNKAVSDTVKKSVELPTLVGAMKQKVISTFK